MTNLLANARTHTPPGTHRHRHAGRRSGHGAGSAVVDDGPGHPGRLLPHVFERFARGDARRARGSTAAPASAWRSCARSSRRTAATSSVTSRPGHTEFTVRLPARRVPQAGRDRFTADAQAVPTGDAHSTDHAPRSGHVTADAPRRRLVPSATTDPLAPWRGRDACVPGTARSPPCWLATALLYLWGLGASGWANSLLLRRRAGRLAELEGALLRLLRRGELDHRRQDAAALWLDGARRCGSSGSRSWSILVPQALMGVATVGAALRDGAPHALAVSARPRGPARRGGAGADPGRGADVPVQQPGRAARAAAGGRGVRDAARGRARRHPVAGAGRAPGRLRLPDQDAAGVPGGAGVRAGLPVRRAGRLRAAAARTCALAAVALVVRAGWWVLVVELWPAADRPYIGGSQHNTSWSSPSATTASAGSPATRPAASAARRAAAGARPG